MSLKEPMAWFWANNWPEIYHPVVCHLMDVGAVAQELWTRTIRKQIKAAITKQLGLSDLEAGAWMAFWGAAHDIGKITPCFQRMGNSSELVNRLMRADFDFPTSENLHHTVSGTFILRRSLVSGGDGAWQPVSDLVAQKIAVAIGGHHGTFPTAWDTAGPILGNEKWAEARTSTLIELARLFALPKAPPRLVTPEDQSVWMFLAGLTAVADWIGSNESIFKFSGTALTPDKPFFIDDYFANARRLAADALSEFGWLGREAPTQVIRSFTQATGIGNPRPLQQVIATKMTTPQLIIVEAPMGEGKTEAAWYVADCWERRGGAGTYVALPTMATSNQMFDRVGAFLETDVGRHNLQLLHGKAALNPNFEQLRYAARVYDPTGAVSGVVAEEWFAKNKKQALLAPFGVGTIGQVLLAVLQTKHFFVRLYGLAGKCVILDEVHAYDAYMTTLMERLLRWLAALRCPVILLSATLPAERRAKLLKAYAGESTSEPEVTPYPRITTVAVGGTPVVLAVEADPARRKTVRLGWTAQKTLAERLKDSLKDGGCAAVIRNTVGLAQQTYTELKPLLEAAGIRVELFHARFPFGRRQEIEKAVLERYGKTGGPSDRDRRVLVATQVIEQSLDLDFDVMFSDVAPVDLVLQRAGRLHRHDRGERPMPVQEPKLWLIEPGEKDGRPDFGVSEWVYARFVLLRSLIGLNGRKAVDLHRDVEPLIEQIYGNEPLGIRQEDMDDLATSEREMRGEQRKQNRAAKSVMIYRPSDEDLLVQQNAQLQEDDPEAHRKIQAATRDTEPTVQLILVYQCNARDFLDTDGKEPFDPTETPTPARLRRLLDNEVSISNKGCVFHYVKQHVSPGWKKSGMLRFHRVVRLDLEGQSLAGEFSIRYDRELGICFKQMQ